MADTEEQLDEVGEAGDKMERTADEMSKRSEKLGDQIDSAKQTNEQAQADEKVPTASGDWEDTEPDDSTGEDPSGFDDPEDVDDEDDDDYSADDEE